MAEVSFFHVNIPFIGNGFCQLGTAMRIQGVGASKAWPGSAKGLPNSQARLWPPTSPHHGLAWPACSGPSLASPGLSGPAMASLLVSAFDHELFHHCTIDSFTLLSMDSCMSSPVDQDPPHVYFNNVSIAITPYNHDADFIHTVMPYSADTFHSFLKEASFLHLFPELSFKLCHGFYLGTFMPLNCSYTPDNLPGAYQYHSVIAEYIQGELDVGWFFRPILKNSTQTQNQTILFLSASGAPDKYHICCHLSYKGTMGYSVNDEINSKDYSTEWGTAEELADIVCILSLLIPSPRCHVNTFASSEHIPTPAMHAWRHTCHFGIFPSVTHHSLRSNMLHQASKPVHWTLRLLIALSHLLSTINVTLLSSLKATST